MNKPLLHSVVLNKELKPSIKVSTGSSHIHLNIHMYVFEMCRKKSRAKLFWEVYGDPRGHRGKYIEV